MFKMVIVGLRSKIAQSILMKHPRLTLLPVEALESERVDYLFLTSSKDKVSPFIKEYSKSPDLKIFDYSGILKDRYLNKDEDVTYGFEPLFNRSKKLIAMTGCSSLAILNAMYPIKHLLKEEVFIDVKFPRSALKHDSPNLNDLDSNIKSIMYNTHPHQKEVRGAINYEAITLAPNIVDIPNGISVNLFLPNISAQEVKETLLKTYQSNARVKVVENNPSVLDITRTGNTLIYVSASFKGCIIQVVTDNLINDRYLDFL